MPPESRNNGARRNHLLLVYVSINMYLWQQIHVQQWKMLLEVVFSVWSDPRLYNED
jgi:hypothetical protein